MNSRRLLLWLAIAAAPATAAIAAPVTYDLDPRHTHVTAEWHHKQLSHPILVMPINSGVLIFDAANPSASSVEVDIAVNQLHSLVEKLDQHLAADDFFQSATYPSATFRSTKVEAMEGEGHYRVTGTLTVKDQSDEVSLDVHLNVPGDGKASESPALGFDATATISRSAVGLGAIANAVDDAVAIRISTEAYRRDAE